MTPIPNKDTDSIEAEPGYALPGLYRELLVEIGHVKGLSIGSAAQMGPVSCVDRGSPTGCGYPAFPLDFEENGIYASRTLTLLRPM
jgi:hypothetical protein